MVSVLANDPFDAAVDNQHGAGPAGGHPAVEGSSIQGNAVLGSLTDSVLLCMDGPYAVLRDVSILMNHPSQLMPNFITVGQPGRDPT